eukprot:TRINITY_DN817_c0_g1_i1.p1 TRINITY_DN817_c0_g1~~TRINITY_DN817_c0_g1_i1.p1  ORF type:complete len:819 (-),score=234.51 TRINITY_DN817_c0_g1_i1:628-3042(-)
MAARRGGSVVTVGHEGGSVLVLSHAYRDGALQWRYTARAGWATAVVLSTADGYPVVVGNTEVTENGVTNVDAFVLTLDKDTGEELCYYSFGSPADDMATGVVASAARKITVSGYTTGPLFQTNPGASDTFAVEFDQDLLCSLPPSTAPYVFTDPHVAETVSRTITVSTAAAAGGAAAVASSSAPLSAAFQVGSGASAGGTAAFMMFGQLQFISTTALVDANQSEQFLDLASSLNWMNLWWDASALVPSGSCIANDNTGVGGTTFIGNTILVVGLTTLIVLIHLLGVSLVEAYWLAKDKGRHHLSDVPRTFPDVEVEEGAPSKAARSTSAVLSTSSESGLSALAARTAAPIAGLDCEMRASKEPSDAEIAEIMPIRRATSSARGMASKRMFDAAVDTPVKHIRQRSTSLWLHFPHVELIFLLFAYEGAVAAQASMLSSPCTSLVASSVVLLVLYPILLLLLAIRVIQALRVGTAVYIAHGASKPSGDAVTVLSMRQRCCSLVSWPLRAVRALATALREAWHNGESIFVAGDKGHWEVPDTILDEDARLERESFMIGFEPVFRDFSAHGTYYIVVVLLRLMGTALISALVVNGPLASALLCGLYAFNLVLVVLWRPFCNTFLQFAEVTSLAINLACLLIMWLGATRAHNNTTLRDMLYGSFLALQVASLLFITVPVYVDLVLVVIGRVNKKLSKQKAESKAEAAQLLRAPVRVSAREVCHFFGIMVRENGFAMWHSLRSGATKSDEVLLPPQHGIIGGFVAPAVVETRPPRRMLSSSLSSSNSFREGALQRAASMHASARDGQSPQ